MPKRQTIPLTPAAADGFRALFAQRNSLEARLSECLRAECERAGHPAPGPGTPWGLDAAGALVIEWPDEQVPAEGSPAS